MSAKGGTIAGAWACLCAMGEEGYLKLTASVMDTKSELLLLIATTE